MGRPRDIADSASVINALDGVTATGAEINTLDGITSTTAELNILDGVTSTASELNILDGVTSTAAEINILDGVTSTAAELNILDGVTSTATELNVLDGVTANATEINKLDALSRGSILYGDASGATAILTKGSANQILKSDGTDIAWGAAAAGGTSGWEVLQTVTASGASTVDVGSSSIFDSTYDAYAVIGTNMKFSADNNSFAGRMALGGTVQTTSYQMATAYMNSSGSSQSLEYTNTGGYIQFARSGVRDPSYASASIEVRINSPSTSGIMKTVQHHYYGVGSFNADTDCSYSHGVGQCGVSTNALTGFRFYPLSGTISGVFRVYGISKS